MKLLWIVAAHLRQYRAVRVYRGRPHWGVRHPRFVDARFTADALNGFTIIWNGQPAGWHSIWETSPPGKTFSDV